MTIEIVDFPMKNGGSFHSYVNVYQRVVYGFQRSLDWIPMWVSCSKAKAEVLKVVDEYSMKVPATGVSREMGFATLSNKDSDVAEKKLT